MIAALAMFYPTYISLVIAIVTQILFILLPLNSNRRLRLRVYSIVVYVMLALLLVVYGMKVYFVYDDATRWTLFTLFKPCLNTKRTKRM